MTDLPYWTLHEAPPDSPKKWAVRVPTPSGRGKTVLFGGRGYEDFTTHHDIERRERYRTRHQRDRLDDPYAPGFWSMWALWGESDDLDTAFAAAVSKAKKLLEKNMARNNPDITKAKQQRAEQHLEKPIRFQGNVVTIRRMLEKLNEAGAVLQERQEPKIKDMSRAAFNRADGAEQEAHAQRQREAGMVTKYYAFLPDGIFYELKKVEADYFNSLIPPESVEEESASGLPMASDDDLAHLFGTARKNPVREQFNYEEYASRLTDDQVHYAILDALHALKVARTWEDNGAGEAKYLDQLSVLRREQQERKMRHNPEWARKIGSGLYRGAHRAAKYTVDVGRDLYHGAREAHAQRTKPSQQKHRSNPSACVEQYLETALSYSTDEEGEPLHKHFSIDDFAPEAVAVATEDCADFMAHHDLGPLTEEEVGHNFWLTRNWSPETGFWDMDLGSLGSELTKSAQSYGDCVIYLGDDGKLYFG